MKKLLIMLLVLVLGTVVSADMVAKYSFEGNLNDTAIGGTTADNLVGMRYYPGNGKFDGSVTSYNPDGTSEVLTTGVTAATYGQGISGNAVRIGARGVYKYIAPNIYPNSSGYQVPAIDAGATYLSSTADSADLSLGGEFTIEGFFKPDAVGGIGGLGEFAYTRLITKWVSGFNQAYHFTIHNGALELIEKNAAAGTVTTAGSVSVQADEWFYIAATGDTEFMSLYFYTKDNAGNIIGGQVGTAAAYAGTMNDSTDPLWIGGRLDIINPVTNNNGFIGLVDEVQLWNEYKDASYFAARAEMIPEPITLVILGLGGLLIRRK
ncbi:MAG: hypothetical protein A2Y12_07315 [Planctomycetes bacterium GWF2_42_9]|nr:MAG: hypothetical protein A2Y12_07315 [Planctomycetes bacterium GWF2_42_9]HAL44539.1 hypothetical protein [Phycisphaerales bacterium]